MFETLIYSEKIFNRNPFAQWHPNKYSEKDILKLLIYHYVPFHINFIKSWIESEIKGKKIFVNYKDFIKNPDKIMEKILGNEIKINKQLYELEILNKKSINYNIGSKRENTLQNDEKKLQINFQDICRILQKSKSVGKIVGGYYPYNFEVDTTKILKQFEKKKYVSF